MTFVLMLGTASSIFAVTKTSTGSGNWNTAGTWSPSGVPANGDAVIIATGHNVTLNVNTTNLLSITINAGGTLSTTGAFTVNATTITVDGTYTNVSTGNITVTTMNVNSGGTYTHGINAGTIPTATWNAASTCNVTGVTSTIAGGLGQAFGNFTYNSSGQTGPENLPGSGMSVAGNFQVLNTGGGQLRMSQTPLTITGNCTISDDFRIGSNGAARTLNVAGNFILNDYPHIVPQ